jgi:Holliday junction resolvase RusA-like endonuclease
MEESVARNIKKTGIIMDYKGTKRGVDNLDKLVNDYN